MKVFACFFLALLVVASALQPARAQVDYSTSTLTGVVYDPLGAVIPTATVTVTNASTGAIKTVKVNADGSYTIPVLPPGTYKIVIEAPNFEREVVQSFTLQVGSSSEYNSHLKLGATSETVEILGDSAPVIQLTQTQQADFVDQVAEANVPSISRDYSQTIQILPGITNAAAVHTSGAQRNIGAFPVNNFTTAGGNGRAGLVTVDGGENDYGSGASRVSHISPDAIQELQVNRNSYTAEFGFTLAEHVNVATKSGGDQFHGNIFGLFRNQSTDAKQFFQLGKNNVTNQDYHLGASLGGPLASQKLFFFLNVEGYRTTVENQKTFNTQFLTAPSPAQQAYIAQVAATNPGAGAALTAILTPGNNPFAQQLVAGQSGLFTDSQKWWDALARLDWTPTSGDTFTLRLLHERLDDPLDLTGGTGGYAAGTAPTTAATYATKDTTRDYEVLVRWSHVFSGSLVNTLRTQIVPDNTLDLTWDDGLGGPNLPFSTFTDGFGTFGPLLGSETLTHQRRYQFEDSVTWTTGKHTLKFGGSYRPVKYTYFSNLYAHSQVAYVPGILPILTPGILPPALAAQAVAAAGLPGPDTNLTSLQSFGFGLPTQFRTSTGNNAFLPLWAHYGGFYIQDSWKLTPRLTADYGVRLDVDAEPFPNSNANFYASPRLGFAYDPIGDGKTVLRAGGGIFVAPSQFQNAYYSNLYNPTGKLGYAQAVEQIGTPGYAALLGVLFKEGNLPVLKPVTAADYAAAGINIAQGQANGVGIIIPPGGYKNNYGLQASLSIQRQLSANMSFELGYNFQHTVHLQDPKEVGWVNNPAIPANPLFGPTLMPNPANNPLIGGQPTFETLTEYCACGSAIYHAGTASLTRRFSNRLYFQANYTWSKAIDDVLDFSSFDSSYYPTIPGKDRAISPFNVSHTFTASAVYTTPYGPTSGIFGRAFGDITLAPLLNFHSGTPFEIFVAPPPGFGNPAAPGNGLVQEALNQARPFNAPRDSGILPWVYRTDLKVSKEFRLSSNHESLRLAVSVTAANLFNRTNFTGVNGNFGNAVPGGINAAPVATAGQAAATILPNGGNLLNGPYNLRGVKAFDALGIPGQAPLSFDSADIARQVQFGLRLSF